MSGLSKFCSNTGIRISESFRKAERDMLKGNRTEFIFSVRPCNSWGIPHILARFYTPPEFLGDCSLCARIYQYDDTPSDFKRDIESYMMSNTDIYRAVKNLLIEWVNEIGDAMLIKKDSFYWPDYVKDHGKEISKTEMIRVLDNPVENAVFKIVAGENTIYAGIYEKEIFVRTLNE